MKRLVGVLGACLTLLAAALFASSPASAVDPCVPNCSQYPDVELDPVITNDVTVTEDTYTLAGSLLGEVTFDDSTADLILGTYYDALGGAAPSQADPGTSLPLAAGTGGKSSASGCRTVTIHNVGHTALHFVAYKYVTWTHWCWNRAKQTVSSVNTGWRLENVDSQEQWKGEVTHQLNFFAWKSGAPKSGYIHMREGHFQNCVFKFGCVADTYPINRIRSRSDGTWYWSKTGAA